VDVVLKLAVIVVKNVLTSGIEGCKMNKRIEKLFNEAGFHKPEMERLGIEHKFEKFAELIIRECVDVVKWTPSLYPNDEYVKNIKQHFGVKE
jgi:hypothetical protein